MTPETIEALNAVNARFYHERAEEFSATRERAWQGWDALFDRSRIELEPPRSRPWSVLDVGCGNGRLARFLRARAGDTGSGFGFRYTGIDSSPIAIEEARRRLGESAALFQHDFLSAGRALPPEIADARFDLVVLFGVPHHVPSRERRRALLRALAHNVGLEGRLAVTVWLFEHFERFRKKLVPWAELSARTGASLDVRDLEPGDHIMTWGREPEGYRYCHALAEEEEDELIAALAPDLTLEDRFTPDPEPNRYLVLRRTIGEVK